ncbi:MAG TPA: tetratricopeptide repeat protein, partial [Rhizomicrobium sp.]|nr:tetratricopeptide repeat protein [Rhizomicrobium sp.]
MLQSPLGLVLLGLLVVCVVHAVRTGNVFPWIYVLVFLPAIGPAIYFFMVILPGLSRGRAARRFASGAARAIDPNKDYRAAMREVEMVGSADAKRAFAEQLIQRGQYADAIEMYQNALQGQFATDTALLFGLARAQFMNGDGAGAQASLDAIQKADPKFQSEEAHLLYARALELQGKNDEAA